MDARTKIVCAGGAVAGVATLYWLFRAETDDEAKERQRELNRAAMAEYTATSLLMPHLLGTNPTVVANIQRAMLDPAMRAYPRAGRAIAAGVDMTDKADPLWCRNKTGDCIPWL